MIYTNESNHVYKFKYIHTFQTISRYWVIPSLIINYFPYFHILYKIHILFFFHITLLQITLSIVI